MLYTNLISGYKRVLAIADISQGAIIMLLKGFILSYPNRYSIQISENKHLHPYHEEQPLWPYLNHSCNPNAYIDVNTLRLISLKDISADEEITFDYETTESNIREQFMCKCGSEKCRGLIKGKALIGDKKTVDLLE